MSLAGILLSCVLLLSTAMAQKAASPAGMGTVTGEVFCEDTHLPARLTKVLLVHKASTLEKTATPGEDAAGGTSTQDITPSGQGWTGLNGSYSIDNVPPGDYWVVAERDGYLSPLGWPRAGATPDPKLWMAGLPVVHVAADQVAKADVRLERGGTIRGQVLFEDGSEAAHWKVWLVRPGEPLRPPAESPWEDLGGEVWKPGQTETDDQGKFRMAGIPPGKYLVVAELTMATSGASKDSHLLAFAPGVFRRSEASIVEIVGSAEAAVNLKLDLSGLHSIRGHVLHGNRVTVTNAEAGETVGVARDGSFHLDFLPAGSYTLSVIPEFPDPKDRSQHFDRPQRTVVLGNADVTVEDILLVETVKASVKAKD